MKRKVMLFLSIFILGSLGSCQKVKLEDDEKGKLLLGKWKFQYSGFHTSSTNFIEIANSYEDFEIEFLEGGEICINDAVDSRVYRVNTYLQDDSFTHGIWKSILFYGKKNSGLDFQIHYFSQDSIMLTKLPSVVNQAPSQYNGLNYFKRIN